MLKNEFTKWENRYLLLMKSIFVWKTKREHILSRVVVIGGNFIILRHYPRYCNAIKLDTLGTLARFLSFSLTFIFSLSLSLDFCIFLLFVSQQIGDFTEFEALSISEFSTVTFRFAMLCTIIRPLAEHLYKTLLILWLFLFFFQP